MTNNIIRCKNREETISSLTSLSKRSKLNDVSRVYGKGPLLMSDIPTSCLSSNISINMGIDEAGRGPVLGPMVYSLAYWSSDPSSPSDGDNDNKQQAITRLFKDSKTLTAATRSSLLEKIKSCPSIGFVVRVLHASEISRNMLRRPVPYNLNEMSHDAAMEMIRAVFDAGIVVNCCYVDTVGNPDSYRRRLEAAFPDVATKFVVEKKADAKYAECSAASVVAKVTRDEIVENWRWNEDGIVSLGSKGQKKKEDVSRDFGSGYPSDPKCKKWMEENLLNQVFGYPDLVRFSWGPAKTAVKDNAITVEWDGDEDDEDDNNEAGTGRTSKIPKRGRNQMSVSTFFSLSAGDDDDANAETKRKKHKRRLPFFEKMGLATVHDLVQT